MKKQVHLILFLLIIALSVTVHAQTYTLETSTFRLVFNSTYRASGLREVRYLGPPDTASFPVAERWTNIADVDTMWDWPEYVGVQSISDSVKNLTFYYGPSKSSTMRVTVHQRFLEFELTNITGQVRDIWLFNIVFLMHNGPYKAHSYPQILNLDRGFVSFLTTANANTGIWRWTDDSTKDMHYASSPRYVPSVGQYVRNQRFAYSICRRNELPQIVREIEAYFGYPYGWSLKENPENNFDYLFLMNVDSVSSQNIIQLCRQTNLYAVMLYQFFWSDFNDQNEPFKIKSWIPQFISDLKAAGLAVGLHSYVHWVPANGYYATHYPNSFSTIIDHGRQKFRFNDTLPELLARDYAEKVHALGADWIFFDGQQHLYEEGGQLVSKYDWYLVERIDGAVMNELIKRNHPLRIFQTAGEGTGGYHYISRRGQVDYWDDLGSPPYRTPIGQMNKIVRDHTPCRFALGTLDLGWFGREIHIPSPPSRRDAQWDEWQHLCSLSLAHNIPIGIRTIYEDFMTDPLRDSIIVLVRETIRQRRGLTSVRSADAFPQQIALEQNYPNPFNPTTTISFSLPSPSFVSLTVFDALGREISTLVSGKLPPGVYAAQWNAAGLASGVYFYRLEAGSFIQTKKLLLLR